jgi:hypothetical protein
MIIAFSPISCLFKTAHLPEKLIWPRAQMGPGPVLVILAGEAEMEASGRRGAPLPPLHRETREKAVDTRRAKDSERRRI